ncbi:MAG: EamA family transporter [Roseibium sp.]|nr:EamA family transporter [Roseibium sp.]
MDLWIPITIFAAFSQNVRSALQKHLKGRLGTTGATFIRFAYGFPFALIYVAVLHVAFAQPLPVLSGSFFLAGALGGLAQIAATFLLLHLFSYKNFTVGTAYSKTEPIQAALFGWVFLGEVITPLIGLAIGIGVFGVVLISLARSRPDPGHVRKALMGRPALIGLASAALFGASAAAYRAASLSLDGTGVFMQAGFALAAVTMFQTLVMAAWMVLRTPAELQACAMSWRQSIWVGLVGVAGSVGWFTAMTLQKVAYVRALAQIELVFTLAVSVFVFREHIRRAELSGCALILSAVVIIVLAS